MNPGHWLIHRVKRRRQGPIDANGDPGYGSVETIRCLVEHKHKAIRGADGRETVISSTLWTLTEPRATDTYWLPGSDLRSTPDERSDQGRSPVSIQGATALGTGGLRAWLVYFA